MKPLLVTGGCGFIGSNFVRALLAAGAQRVVNLDLLSYAGNPANLADVAGDGRYRFVRGDIGDTALAGRLLREEGIGAVVHFAAESHVDRSIDGPRAFLQTNVMGTLSLLEAARDHWKGGTADFLFLHVSTDEVFGSLRAEDPPFSETTPYDPRSPYAASKAASDHVVRAFHHTYGLPVRITNCSNNYGPYQFPEKLIPLVILNALEEKPLPIYGDGQQIRDWLHVEDHCAAILRVLEAGRDGESYNIGGEAEKANLEIVDTLCAILDELRPRTGGRKYGELKTHVPDRPGHDRRYAMDIRKIGAELGWAPRMGFAEGMRRTVEWYLANRAWCADIRTGRYQGQRLGLGSNG